MAETVALIGVGKMGRALLHRLNGQGHRVRAFDIADEPMAAAAELGAATLSCSAEAARGAGFIHVFVHNDQEVFDCTLSPGGALEGAAAGSIILLHSTILPATTKRVAEAAAEKGVAVLDASVTSVPRRLQAGEATFLIGGPDDLVDLARAHLEPLGRTVHHFGPLGSGNVAKIAKNLTNAVERVMWAETVQLVETAGLDPRQFLEMAREINTGAAIETWERMIRIEDGHTGPQRARGLLSKDVQHAARLAREHHLDLPIALGTADTALRWLDQWSKEPKT